MSDESKPANVDAYIAACSLEVRPILEQIRSTIREVAPEAEERISYRMPAAFTRHGVLIYYAAFKKHIGLYPPLKGNEPLREELAPYRGEKGNLKFPLDKPIPHALIKRVVQARLQEQRAKVAAKRSGK